MEDLPRRRWALSLGFQSRTYIHLKLLGSLLDDVLLNIGIDWLLLCMLKAFKNQQDPQTLSLQLEASVSSWCEKLSRGAKELVLKEAVAVTSCVPLGCSLGLSALHFPSMCQEATDTTSLTLSHQYPLGLRATWLPSVPHGDHMSPLSQGLSCTFRGL